MSHFESEAHAILTFNRITFAYPQLATRLIHGFDSAQAFFAQYDKSKIKLPPRLASYLENPFSALLQKDLERDCVWLSGDQHCLVSIFDQAYPFLLQQIDDPPICLFCNGNIELLKRDQISIVGSRKPTQVGEKISKSFAAELSARGLVITSGLAYGIDAAAHVGAIEKTGETIAVLGTGGDLIYPRSHERLAMRILERGLLVSEYPVGTPPHGRYFPQRNRIVTGLSTGTVVVEAALKSGSLISARLAMEQGREVFAVPGSIYSAQSAGCHQLIKVGAKLTQNVDDLVEELPGYGRETGINAPTSLSSEAQLLIPYFGAEPLTVDALFERSEIPIANLLALLLELEVEGLILASPMGYSLARASM